MSSRKSPTLSTSDCHFLDWWIHKVWLFLIGGFTKLASLDWWIQNLKNFSQISRSGWKFHQRTKPRNRLEQIELVRRLPRVFSNRNFLILFFLSRLRSLSLRYANLDDGAMENLAKAWRLVARDRPGLEFLDLSRNRITDRGLEHLIQVQTQTQALIWLEFAQRIS
jgi:hypothetical protein